MEHLEKTYHMKYTLLSASAQWQEIIDLCENAIEEMEPYVCVPPCYVAKVKEVFGEKVRICTVAGFPTGHSMPETKVTEIRQALKDGADRVEVTGNLCDMKNHDFGAVQKEMKMLREAAGTKQLGVVLKTVFLTDTETEEYIRIIKEAGIDYIRTENTDIE